IVLRPMIADSSARAAASVAGSGRSSGWAMRMDFGTAWEISVSTDGMPRAASMARWSGAPGPMWRRAKGRASSVMSNSLADQLLVGGFIHQRGKLAVVGKLHLPEPPVAGSGRVDERRLAGQRF